MPHTWPNKPLSVRPCYHAPLWAPQRSNMLLSAASAPTILCCQLPHVISSACSNDAVKGVWGRPRWPGAPCSLCSWTLQPHATVAARVPQRPRSSLPARLHECRSRRDRRFSHAAIAKPYVPTPTGLASVSSLTRSSRLSASRLQQGRRRVSTTCLCAGALALHARRHWEALSDRPVQVPLLCPQALARLRAELLCCTGFTDACLQRTCMSGSHRQCSPVLDSLCVPCSPSAQTPAGLRFCKCEGARRRKPAVCSRELNVRATPRKPFEGLATQHATASQQQRTWKTWIANAWSVMLLQRQT
jgi:hypothetical protein